MGDGLQRAVLGALCSRGPWRSGHPCDTWELTGEELRTYFQSIQRGAEDPSTLNFTGGSRKLDRARQLLRQAKLIEFVRRGKDRHWRTTGNDKEP